MTLHEVLLHPSRRLNMRVLVITSLITGLIMGFYQVILQPFLVDIIRISGNNHNPEVTLGTIMTLASVIQVIPMVFAGKISDKIGRKRVIIGGFLFMPIAMILMGLSGLFTLKQPINIILFREFAQHDIFTYLGVMSNNLTITYVLAIAFLGLSCVSLGIGFSDPATQALTAESAEKKKTASSFSIISMAYYATGLIGPLLIRILTDKIEIWVYFFVLAGLRMIIFVYQLFTLREPHVIKDFNPSFFKQFLQALVAIYHMFLQMFKSSALYLSIPIYYILKRIKKKESSNYFKNIETNLTLLKEIFRNPGVPYAIGFFMLDALTWGLSISIFWGSVVIEYNFNEGNVAILNLIFNLSTLVFFIPVTKISDKLTKPRLLLLSQLTGGIFFIANIVAYYIPNQFRLYVIMVGWVGLGASVAFWMPGIMTILTNFDKRRRAEVYGLVSGLHSLGWLPTAAIAGLIIDKIGFIAIFIISMVLLPFNLLMSWKFPINEEQEEKDKTSEQ